MVFDDAMVEANGGIIPTMVSAYDVELQQLVDTYRSVVKIDTAILKELGVSKKTILEGLRTKTSGLKNRYWEALFNHLGDITKRLATKQREEFLNSLTDKVVIDFTEDRGIKLEDLRLLLCKPTYCTEIDPIEHYEDILPTEDYVCMDPEDHIPAPILEAFEQLNKVIRENKKAVSWSCINVAVDLASFEQEGEGR